MSRWLRRLAPIASMSLLTLVLAHDLVFVAGHGVEYRQILVRTGHGDSWTTAVLMVLTLGLVLLLAGVGRIARLRRDAKALAPGPIGLAERPAFLPGYVSLWLRLAVSSSVLYALQENVEHAVSSAVLPGLSVLDPAARPDILLIVSAVAAVVALVGQLYRWRHDTLAAAIAAARHAWGRIPARSPRPQLGDDRHPPAILGRTRAPRAPPA